MVFAKQFYWHRTLLHINLLHIFRTLFLRTPLDGCFNSILWKGFDKCFPCHHVSCFSDPFKVDNLSKCVTVESALVIIAICHSWLRGQLWDAPPPIILWLFHAHGASPHLKMKPPPSWKSHQIDLANKIYDVDCFLCITKFG